MLPAESIIIFCGLLNTLIGNILVSPARKIFIKKSSTKRINIILIIFITITLHPVFCGYFNIILSES